MTFDSLVTAAVSCSRQYPLVLALLGIGLAVMVYRNPKESCKFGIFLLVMAAVLYAIGLFGDTVELGVGRKQQAIHKTENAAK